MNVSKEEYQPFFKDPRNGAMFLILSVLPLSPGNILLGLIIAYNRGNQFALLPDKLGSTWQLTMIFHNVVIFAFAATLLAVGAPHHAVCALFAVAFRADAIVIGLNMAVTFGLRLLYITRWSSRDGLD